MAVEQTALTIVGPPVKKEPGMQESDLLDMLPDGEAKVNSGTDHIKLVSLGCYCGPKLSFKHIGRGAETLPFDWMRTRHEGLLKFMREDFSGFFEFVSKKPVPGCEMTTYRSYYHSFWHDDPSCPGMRTRYQRRIDRFKGFENSSDPILFVRTIPTTDELKVVPELLSEITTRYGKSACLLLIIDFQWTASGPAIIDGYPNMMAYYLHGNHHVNPDGTTAAAPYCEPVLCALDWMIGKPIQAMKFPSMEEIIACADVTHWGLEGLGGLKAFESDINGPEEKPLQVTPQNAKPSVPPLISAEELEGQMTSTSSSSSAKLPPDGITTISLGATPATKMTLQAMNRGNEALPFDWLWVSHEGVLHFLNRGFEAPIREGLGAGGQRPTEKNGYLDCVTRKRIPNSNRVMCRSHLHSFWYDDVGEPEDRERLLKRVSNWNRIEQGRRPLLFVRAVATAAELARADELLSALFRKFGQNIGLLLIVDYQETDLGPFVVDGLDDLLVYRLSGSCHSGEQAAAPYRNAVDSGLDWIKGNPIEASCAADLASLARMTTPTDWGLRGPTGLPAFHLLTQTDEDRVSAVTAAESAWLEEAKRESYKDAFALISLGCCPVVAQALCTLGLAAEESPFDGLQVSTFGVRRALITDFREFFNVSSTEILPGTSVRVRRAGFHCFCDSFGDDVWKQAYEKVIDQFRKFVRSGRPKMFVHAVTHTDELQDLWDLREEIMAFFGTGIFLVVIVGGQEAAKNVSVDNMDNMLVVFTPEVVGVDMDPKKFAKIVKPTLDWAVGRPTRALTAPDAPSLLALARPFKANLGLPGGGSPFTDATLGKLFEPSRDAK
mmetsp:Transcript_82362/g.181153  ORF Transcript_82362/g.181153 Transcript_82362/m.181153 type:complete len:834 (+) Transcript_82362:64-2565(+)